MHTIESRVSKLEERCEAMHNLITDNVIERRRQSDKTTEMLEDIQEKINKMQGYGAGVASVFGVIGAGIGLLWDNLKD